MPISNMDLLLESTGLTFISSFDPRGLVFSFSKWAAEKRSDFVKNKPYLQGIALALAALHGNFSLFFRKFLWQNIT